jgi:hypothetical protein
MVTGLGNFFASCVVLLFPNACKGKACYFITLRHHYCLIYAVKCATDENLRRREESNSLRKLS